MDAVEVIFLLSLASMYILGFVAGFLTHRILTIRTKIVEAKVKVEDLRPR